MLLQFGFELRSLLELDLGFETELEFGLREGSG